MRINYGTNRNSVSDTRDRCCRLPRSVRSCQAEACRRVGLRRVRNVVDVCGELQALARMPYVPVCIHTKYEAQLSYTKKKKKIEQPAILHGTCEPFLRASREYIPSALCCCVWLRTQYMPYVRQSDPNTTRP